MIRLSISGCGSYLPQHFIYNNDLPAHLETNDEWIRTRTGITKRHIAQDETTSDMASAALLSATQSANISVNEIDCIIVATCTGDKFMPSTANIVQNKIGLSNKAIPSFDIQAACSGFLYAMNTAESLLQSNHMMQHIAVIGAEKMSSIVDWHDRRTCVLFGDGAGAVILSKTNNTHSKIIDRYWFAKPELTNILHTDAGTSKREGYLMMNGQEVFKHAVREMAGIVRTMADRNNIAVSSIKKIIPHQANERMIPAIAKLLNTSTDSIVSTIGLHANTSAASIPLALDSVYDELNRGDLIALVSAGAGMTFGGILLQY